MNEIKVCIKLNNLFEEAGWRFFTEDSSPANILLESDVSIRASDLVATSNNFKKTLSGYFDLLLLDDKSWLCIVLQIKLENKNPLVDKKQTPKYTCSQRGLALLVAESGLFSSIDLL